MTLGHIHPLNHRIPKAFFSAIAQTDLFYTVSCLRIHRVFGIICVEPSSSVVQQLLYNKHKAVKVLFIVLFV